jgi:hypothetical protein
MRLCTLLRRAALAGSVAALPAGCQLVANLRDIEAVDASAGADTGLGAEVTTDSPHDSSMPDGMPEAGVPDGPYGSSELELIDNMEDRTGSIADVGGRNGPWFTYNDETLTGQQTPKAGAVFSPSANDPPRLIPESLGGGESHYAAQTTGSGFTTWGAGMGFNFLADASTAYDASAYLGFVFWGRIGSQVGEDDGGVFTIRLNVPDMNTDPRGGVCSEAGMTCNDFFGRELLFSTEWQEFVVLFADLGQSGFGTPEPAVDAANVYACQFLISTDANNDNSGQAFDLWIDDIYFIKKSD